LIAELRENLDHRWNDEDKQREYLSNILDFILTDYDPTILDLCADILTKLARPPVIPPPTVGEVLQPQYRRRPSHHDFSHRTTSTLMHRCARRLIDCGVGERAIPALMRMTRFDLDVDARNIAVDAGQLLEEIKQQPRRRR